MISYDSEERFLFMIKSDVMLKHFLNKYFNGSFKDFYNYMVDDSATTINTPKVLIPVIEDNIDLIKTGANDVLHLSKQEQVLNYLKHQQFINSNQLFVADDIDETCSPLLSRDLKHLSYDLAHPDTMANYI